MTNYEDPEVHSFLILDTVRTSTYARAINRVVRRGDVVMDIGSGSGILALLAARAGAQKVYAIERTSAVNFVRSHAMENGFENVIQAIHADMNDLDSSMIDKPPRVIVSELLSNFAPSEGIHEIFKKAKGISQPGAIFIPQSYKLVFAAARPQTFEKRVAALANIPYWF